MKFNDTRSVKVEARLQDMPLQVTGVTLSHELGMMPNGNIRLAIESPNPAKRESVQLNLDRIGNLNNLLQDKFCNHFALVPDLRVTVEAEDQKIDFLGFAGRPASRLLVGTFQQTLTVVHPQSLLAFYNPRMYSLASFYLRQEADQLAEVRKTSSLAERIRLYLNALEANYAHTKNVPGSPELKVTPLHTLNQQVRPWVDKFLARSLESTRIVGIDHPQFNDRILNQRLLEFISGTPHLMGVLGRLQPEFFLQLNADWKGDAWLERAQALDLPGPREIRAPIADFSFNISSQFAPPVVQVLVTGQGTSSYMVNGVNNDPSQKGESTDANLEQLRTMAVRYSQGQLTTYSSNDWHAFSSLTSIARYPESVPENAAGRYETVCAPRWLQTYEISPTLGENQQYYTKLAAEKNFRGLDSKLLAAADLNDTAKRQDMAGQRITESLLRWVARQTFESIYLDSTTARVTVPLMLEVQAGRTYFMRDDQGVDLFSGFLVSIEHNVELSGEGTEGSATTTLLFTHILAPRLQLNPQVPLKERITTTLWKSRGVNQPPVAGAEVAAIV